MSLRRRLAFTLIALIVAGCIALASISLTVIDRTLRAEIDERLATIAYGEAQIVDDDRGAAVVDADDVAQMNALHHPDEHVAVIDRRGHLIFGELVPSGPAAANLRFDRIAILHPKKGRIDNLGTLVVWQSDSWIDSVRRTSVLTFAAVTIAVALFAGFFSRRFADAILNPIDRVAELAERIEGNDLSERLGRHSPDELGRLCASFDRMLERLQASFETERRFVTDASHELRAPLAVVRAETDLALRRDRSGDEYRSALESIDRETARLESLVDQLLGTMRESTVVGDEIVDVGAMLAVLAERMRSATEGIHLAQTGGDALVRGHAQSIERAFTAVLHNALTHGGGGHIEILVTSSDQVVRIDIVDDGTGFCEEALAHATERFWRGDTARTRGGTGLGLAIARVLVEVHGGELRLTNTQHAGAATSLLLPRAAG
jgi:signal transduction histidine kinase